MTFGHGRNAILKIDNASGVLTDISAYVTEADLPVDTQTIDVTPLAGTWRESMIGVQGAALACRGVWNATIDYILWSAKGTARSFEYYPLGYGYPYYMGEMYGISYRPPISIGDAARWDFAAIVNGAVTRRAAQLAYLESHWKLNETSGIRADSHGANSLADNNTVTSAAGQIGNAASFASASSEWLSIADNASLSIGLNTNFAFAGWVKLTTKAATMAILGKASGGAGTFEYELIYNNGSDRFDWFMSNGSALTNVAATSFGSPSTATWYFFFIGYDAATQKSFIQINNGTMNESATHTGAQNGTNGFALGAQSAAGGEYLNGQMDSVWFWKGRIPTVNEITEIYSTLLDYPGN